MTFKETQTVYSTFETYYKLDKIDEIIKETSLDPRKVLKIEYPLVYSTSLSSRQSLVSSLIHQLITN